MRVRVRGKNAQDVVVFVDGLAVVAAFLLVPPVGVGVAELALYGRWIGVISVLILIVMVRAAVWLVGGSGERGGWRVLQ